jgi:hypothetical protein
MSARLIFVVSCALAFVSSVPAAPTFAAPVADPSEPCLWSTVQGPSPAFDDLSGLFAVSEDDIWAVGGTQQGGVQPLRSHWNGHEWSSVSGVAVTGSLFDVDGSNSSDVWAVGVRVSNQKTHIEHWNGTSWSLVSSPDPGTIADYLYDVEAISSNDVWAVGYQTSTSTPDQSQALIEHYDGVAWTVAPAPAGWHFASGIAAVSSNDIWLTGSATGSAVQVRNTAIAHWDGSAWTVVPSPNGPKPYNELTELAVVSPTDIWTIGISSDLRGTASINAVPFALRWDGSVWRLVTIPALKTFTILRTITAPDADHAWAVGTAYDSADLSDTGREVAAIARWDGSVWTIAQAPASQYPAQGLEDVEALSAHDVWAVGSNGVFTGSPPYTAKTLFQHCVPLAVGGMAEIAVKSGLAHPFREIAFMSVAVAVLVAWSVSSKLRRR